MPEAAVACSTRTHSASVIHQLLFFHIQHAFVDLLEAQLPDQTDCGGIVTLDLHFDVFNPLGV